jgi:hypothetical protein
LHLIRQGYENKLLVLLDDNNKLVETIRNNHLYALSVVKSTHANKLRVIKSTHTKELRVIKSAHAKKLRVIKSTHAKERRVINLTHADELRTLRTAQREQKVERRNILWSVLWSHKGHSRYRNSITFLDGFLLVEVVFIASTVMFILWVCLYQRPFVKFMAHRIECKWSGRC